MELSKSDMKRTQGLAVLFMVILHLFQRNDWEGLYSPLLFASGKPVIFYFGIIADCCVALFAMCSGYALFYQSNRYGDSYFKRTLVRLGKMMLNYWAVLLLFVLFCFFSGNTQNLKGGLQIVKHVLLLSKGYNGAWWYVLTYILLMLLSPFIVRFTGRKQSQITVFICSLVLFIITHFIKENDAIFGDSVFGWVLYQVVLLFNTLFPFICGFYIAKFGVFSIIRPKMRNISPLHSACMQLLLLLIMVTCHALIPSSIVAPFTGIAIFLSFNLLHKGQQTGSVFAFLGEHSTNIWLTHMFFYVERYGSIAYKAKYVLLILLVTLGLSILVSFLVKFFLKPVYRCYNRITPSALANV